MLDEIITHGLRNFQQDCLQLCEHHYPTIHNRGMLEAHLGKSLSRRMVNTFAERDIDATFQQIEKGAEPRHPVFHICTAQYEIYIVTHRMISANKACRKALVRDIGWPLSQILAVAGKQYRVLIVADHWVDRSNASKSIPSWWLGHQPIHSQEYLSQGVKLVDSDHSLEDDIKGSCGLVEGKYRLYHPLNRQKDSIPLYKYMLMTAFYDVSKRHV